MLKKKKLIIILIILFIIVLLIISLIIIKSINNKDTKIQNNKTTTSKEVISSYEETTTSSETTTTSTITSTTRENTTTNKTTKNTTKESTRSTTKSTITSTTVKQLSCPSGYTLINNMCTITVNANYVCPTNTHESSADECVSFTGSIPAENDTCPPGYQRMTMISIGSPDRTDCLPLYKKVYKCDDGYTLHDTNKCSKTINPQ